MRRAALTAFDVTPRQIDPTGKSLPLFGGLRVQPSLKKYSA
jgi:hypothetical protein